jgi:type VI protein secretion system component Hcp
MSADHDGKSLPLTANRRNVLLGATGLAAAAMVGSALGDNAGVAQAQGKPTNLQIEGLIGDMGPFEVMSFSWGVSNTGSASGGSGTGAGKVKFKELTLTKYADAQSPRIQFACASGQRIESAVINLTDNRGNSILQYELVDVTVAHSDIDVGGASDAPVEEVALAFGAVRMMVGNQGYQWSQETNSGGVLP